MYFKAKVGEQDIFFELTTAQLYGKGEEEIPIVWVEQGRAFVGNLLLQDVLNLDIQPEDEPIEQEKS